MSRLSEDRGSDADDRSRTAIAYSWASRGMSIAMEMVLPGLFGYGLDYWLGTEIWFTIAGFGLGFTLGLLHLVRLSKEMTGPPPNR